MGRAPRVDAPGWLCRLPATMRNSRISSWRLAFFALLAVGTGLSACRGCDKPAPPAAAIEPATAIDARRADLLARFADLKIDRSRVYPKDERGVVTCGDDMQCFVAQAENCLRAEVTSKITDSGYGIHNVVEARYTIEGSEPNRCRLSRHVLSANAYFEEPLVAAMRAEGKSETEVDEVQTEATARLRRRTTPQLDCTFTNDDVLEATIDLAHQLFNDKLFRLNCHESNVAARPLEPPTSAPAPAGGAERAAPAPIAPWAPMPKQPASKPRKAAAGG
jgi:hypothetical protein